MTDTDEITRLRAENERLREWNAEIALNARELVAENERLRAALQDIIADSFSVYAIEVARAALAAQPAPGKEEA